MELRIRIPVMCVLISNKIISQPAVERCKAVRADERHLISIQGIFRADHEAIAFLTAFNQWPFVGRTHGDEGKQPIEMQKVIPTLCSIFHQAQRAPAKP